jgi:hypothetical protein
MNARPVRVPTRTQSDSTSTSRPPTTAAVASFETLEPRQLLAAFAALVNFQPQGAQTPSGYRADTGAVFGNRGGGLTYGWNATNNNAIDRNSNRSPDQRYDTFAQMQKNGTFTWGIAVPVGTYNVRLTSGDPVSNDAFYHVFAEGRQMIRGAPSNAQRWIGSNFVVTVNDGRLTVTNGAEARNNKINFIEITKAAPTQPSNLTAAVLSATQVQLNWQDNSNNEDGFVIERSVNQSSTWQVAATVGANVTTFTDIGLTPSTEYRYRVRSFNDVSSFPFYTNIATVVTPAVPGTAPAAPSNLTASVNGSLLTLSWQDNSDNEDTFIIEQRWTPSFRVVKEVSANVTSTTLYVGSGQINQYRVRARNNSGGSSDPSNLVDVVTRPEAPIYPGAQAVSSSAIDIFWDSIDSCLFHVQRLTNGNWVTIAENLGALSFRDTNLPAGTIQSYRIIADGGPTGVSDPSDVVTATTAPAAVTGVHVTGVTSTSVSLAWDDTSGEAGYMIERSTDGITWTLAALTFANVTSYTNNNLASGTTYFFRVTGFAYGLIPGDRSDPVITTTL